MQEEQIPGIQLGWIDKVLIGFEVTTDVVDGVRAAKSPKSDGGTTITHAEIYQIGLGVARTIAERAGVELEADDVSASTAQDAA